MTKSRIYVAVVIGLFLTASISCAQFVPYRLSAGKYSVSAGLSFLDFQGDNQTYISGQFCYGIFKNLNGSFGAGLTFSEKSSDYSSLGFSLPPARSFNIGIAAIDKLGKTGIDYWTSAGFLAVFERIVENTTGATLVTVNQGRFVFGFGIMKEIRTEAGFIFFPLAGIFRNDGWVSVDSDIPGLDFGIDVDDWSGQVGLLAEVSPNLDALGLVIFSFENSVIAYSISLSYRPDR